MDRFSWQAIVALASTVMVAFGAMFFGFSVFLTSDAAGADFSTTVLSLGYGGAALSLPGRYISPFKIGRAHV